MERRKFTREFKLEAVRLIKDRGVSYAQAEQRPPVTDRGKRGRSPPPSAALEPLPPGAPSRRGGQGPAAGPAPARGAPPRLAPAHRCAPLRAWQGR